MSNGSEPAYPTVDNGFVKFSGLTKREVFAMAAMQGYVHLNPGGWTEEVMVRKSLVLADEMLASLEKEPTK